MAIIAIWAYATGTPNNVFRATEINNNICGLTNSPTAAYPYAYFYNPASLNNRVCVATCPSYTNGTLSNITCYNATCTYTTTVKEDGTPNGSFSNTSFIGYGSYSILGRICLPDLVVLNNAFSSYSTALAQKLQASYINRFVSDIQNVLLLINLELVLDFAWIWICNCNFIYFYVLNEMACCNIGLVQYFCNSVNLYRFWTNFPLSRRYNPEQPNRQYTWNFRHTFCG